MTAAAKRLKIPLAYARKVKRVHETMTREELLALPSRDLDAMVAEKVMGWCVHDWDRRIMPSCQKCGADFMKTRPLEMLEFSDDDNSVRLVRNRIAELGLGNVFARTLYDLCNCIEGELSS